MCPHQAAQMYRGRAALFRLWGIWEGLHEGSIAQTKLERLRGSRTRQREGQGQGRKMGTLRVGLGSRWAAGPQRREQDRRWASFST